VTRAVRATTVTWARRRWAGAWLAVLAAVVVSAVASSAAAQGLGGGGAGGGPGRQAQKAPPKGPTPEEEEEVHNAYVRASEPEIAPPSDPLALSPELHDRIGSDYRTGPPSPEGPLRRGFEGPVYVERRGDYRLRLLPPFIIQQTRGLPDPSQALYGVPKAEDTEGLYGLVYYQRTSPQLDMHVVFPAFWHVRDRDNHVVVVGPIVHREAPGESDNWLAPLVFAGGRKDGGYFHVPLLLTTSHWGEKGAFTLVGPYFRDRTGTDVDLGVAPLFFHGDNGSVDGNRRTYTLIPPLLTYHSEHEFDSSTFTVVGPVIAGSDAKRDVFDVAPLYFHIRGKPQTGGVVEDHTTLLPFFHYGHDPDQSLFILPGYYRRVTRTADTLLSLVYSNAQTHNGATSLTAIGPVVPFWWSFRDTELGIHAWALAPFYYTSDSPAGHDWLTPLVGHFETYAQSRTTWVFPTLTFNSNTHGWENDLHPLIYVGRNDDASHTVVAPFFWDFASPTGRTTIGVPFYWRFAEGKDESVLQVAANTVYLQKRVAGGTDWQFHFAPLFSYGEDPRGYFWNILFGLAGYSHHGTQTETRVLWIPFQGTSAPLTQTARGY
jgi:hypothetical protein